MASQQGGHRRAVKLNLILKEGFLYKKGGVIKSWSRRYFILNRQSLCYFRREQSSSNDPQRLEPMGRIFLSDVVNIETDGVEKRKSFVFALHTKKRAVLLQASNNDDREKWVEAVRHALESDSKAEREDPFRKTLRKLKPGLKRVTLMKDPLKGIGCTIKSAGGHVLVNRIVEDGPIAHTGVLRPGDEILDIHGTTVTGLAVSDVVDIIKRVPDQFLATVRPITSITKGKPVDTGTVVYSEILPQSPNIIVTKPSVPDIVVTEGAPVAPVLPSPTTSLDDVGDYDDEEEGDVAPPLPPRTEDALILVDPPPPKDGRSPPLPPKHKPVRDTEDISLPSHNHKAKERGKRMVWSANRPPIQKASSEELAEARVLPRQLHVYDEIQPILNYVDIKQLDLRAPPKLAKSSAMSVEIDWKKKVQV